MPSKRSRKRTRGQDNIKWIQDNCCVPEGDDIGQPVRLRDWQRRIILEVYDNPHGTRLVIISVGRKNGKTALAAFLLLLHLVGPEAVRNSQLYSSAQSKEQAGVLFDLAAKCVRTSPELTPHCNIKDTWKQLGCPAMGTKYRALSAEVKTSFGLSPIFMVHDELGQVQGPTSDLYSALETATAAHGTKKTKDKDGSRRQPLSVVISTQAPTDNDLLSILIDDAVAGGDPKTVLSLWTADKDADPFCEETIRQANPAYGDFQNDDEILAMADRARRMPSQEAKFRNLVLNQRVEAFNPFITKSVWDSCGASAKELPRDTPVYCGLDLSATTDLTAFVRIGKIGDVWQVKPTFWLPEEGLEERARLDRVQYDVWHEQGYLEVCPGKSVDYRYVAEHIVNEMRTTNIKKVAFDRWGFRHLKPWLMEAGLTEQKIESVFVEFGQGFQSMSPALRSLETLILNKQLAHGKHPVLSMCAGVAVVQLDPAGNRKLNKAKSRGRIDGMIALAMAAAVAESTMSVRPVSHELMFV